jgi:UDP-4-amino-4,6-dideoxy-N-acetyl-beta-L-altrosamine transaminase
MDFIPYGKQWIEEDDIAEVVKVLKGDFITQGKVVEKFERALAEYCGAKYCVVFNSGTSALIGAYFAVGLTEGDNFITSPITFVATANAGLIWGAKVRFGDVEEDTGNLSPTEAEKLIDEKTKLIVPVHYAGHPVDLEKFRALADKHNLFLIEDACHALGARYKKSKIGSADFSDAVVFSFHPVKHITTGEGGAVLTNDYTLYKRLKLVRNHGITKNPDEFLYPPDGDWYYEQHHLGFNFRITDFQCALGISQLRKLEKFVTLRRDIAKFYNQRFKGNPYFNLPVEKDYAYHSYHLYPIRLKEKFLPHKGEVFKSLRRAGLGVQVHYIPVYKQPYYRKIGFEGFSLPRAERFYKAEISLPLFPSMDKETMEQVVERTFRVFKEIEERLS